ncbi:MAG: hypothetical protein RIT25_1675 [Planctomycetota bacterium]|jgi:uncharacterized surface protein with fasciclin (FAS1) repeats
MKHALLATITLTTALFAQEQKNIVTVAVEAGQFKTLVAAVQAAGLVETLSGKGPFTVFAPTDEAFAKLGKDAIADLLKPENKDKLTSILTYHVVAGEYPAAKVVAAKSLTTVQGADVTVAAGKDVMVGTAKVLKTDIKASNGIIHVIDSVILPPAANTAEASMKAGKKNLPNLVEVASKAGSFNTLLKAAVAAGLADTLANGGPFTIFAPNDEAFAKLGKDTIADLLKPENKDKLAAILKYHVVSGAVMSPEAVKLTSAKTLQGGDLTLKVVDGKLTIDGAKVIAADVEGSNGVIHVVDSVLLPKK